MTRKVFVGVVRSEGAQATYYEILIEEVRDATPDAIEVTFRDEVSCAYVDSVYLRPDRMVLRRRPNPQAYLEHQQQREE